MQQPLQQKEQHKLNNKTIKQHSNKTAKQQKSLTITTSSVMAPMSNPITYSKLSAMAQKSPSWNNVATTYPKSAPNQYIGGPDTMALGP